jgi:hypothetical protein
MAEGRARDQWDHTAALHAKHANAQPDHRQRSEPLKVDITVLRDVFVKEKNS